MTMSNEKPQQQIMDPINRIKVEMDMLVEFVSNVKNTKENIRTQISLVRRLVTSLAEEEQKKNKINKTASKASDASTATETTEKNTQTETEEWKTQRKQQRKQKWKPQKPLQKQQEQEQAQQEEKQQQRPQPYPQPQTQQQRQQQNKVQQKKPKLTIPRPKTEAITLKRSESNNNTYADILKKIRTTVDIAATGCQVDRIRKTRNGMILMELERNGGNPTTLADAIKTALGDDTTVRRLTTMVKIEVRDLDEGEERQDVMDALKPVLGTLTVEEAEVVSLFNTYNGTRVAVVKMASDKARTILKKGKLRVGWVNCRVRQHIEAVRCYKCQEYGHLAATCSGSDRSQLCRRCGKGGHIAAKCENSLCCIVCKDRGTDTQHMAGTPKCPAYKTELERQRKGKTQT
ncbi:uncharacterized protein LOC143921905 [Arctopsyche grandis]|uniref:uncharacterized protein LOC143921899 n=1 Tax=Arctopsyche grandis TaxID=121162 RepID=UPI00406D8A79